MQFANWQIDRLRRSLNRYRMSKGRNAQLLPWKVVIDHILMSPATTNSYDLRDGESGFKEEALRRFANGQSTLQPDKLDDLRKFFIAENFLRPEELVSEQDDLPGFLSAFDFLATESRDALELFARLSFLYQTSRRIDGTDETIRLHVNVDPSLRFFRVEEEYEVTAERTEHNRRPDGRFELSQKFVRKGYGFASTLQNLLHVFVVGDTPHNRITYVQIEPFRQYGLRQLELIRCGDPAKVMWDEKNPDAPAQVYNYYRFAGSGFSEKAKRQMARKPRKAGPAIGDSP